MSLEQASPQDKTTYSPSAVREWWHAMNLRDKIVKSLLIEFHGSALFDEPGKPIIGGLTVSDSTKSKYGAMNTRRKARQDVDRQARYYDWVKVGLESRPTATAVTSTVISTAKSEPGGDTKVDAKVI